MKNIFLITLLGLVIACGTKEKNDDELLSQRQMVEILTEIHLLEAKMEKIKVKADSARKIYNSLEQEIFDRHGVGKVQYEKSYVYYANNPKKLDKIYEIVVDSLNVLEQNLMIQIEKEEQLEKERQDSIKAAKDSLTLVADSLGMSLDSLLLLSEDSILRAIESLAGHENEVGQDTTIDVSDSTDQLIDTLKNKKLEKALK